MNIISSNARFRQRVVKYSYRYGVSRAAAYYRVSRKAIYAWRKRYDGKSWKSLVEKSHRPKHHPAEHTEAERAMITQRYPKYSDDMMQLWDSLRKSGYTRSYTSLIRVVNKWLKPEKKKQQRKRNKPYQRAEYPGQKVQVDVKFVPASCVSNGRKYYQYTAVDECTRWTYRWIYDEHSTYSSADFLMKLITKAPFPIREIQTDNGTEFTNALHQKTCDHKSLFEELLDENDILYHRIRIATPRHNGKVERQHRIDQTRFYGKLRMYSLEDGRRQIKKYNLRSNSIPKICLGFFSPNEILAQFLAIM